MNNDEKVYDLGEVVIIGLEKVFRWFQKYYKKGYFGPAVIFLLCSWWFGLNSTTYTITSVYAGIAIVFAIYDKEVEEKRLIHYLGIVVICLPWKIGNNMYSMFGGKNDTGSVYSILGFYQEASKNSFSLGPSLYQKSENNSITLLGVSGYQNSGRSSTLLIGISCYQNSAMDSDTWVGIVGYQKAGDDNNIGVGISGYQKAGDDNNIGVGISGYQKALDDNINWLAISGYQKAGDKNGFGVGVVGYQESKGISAMALGIAGYQKAKEAITFFGLSGVQKGSLKAAGVIQISIYQESETLAYTWFGFSGYQKAETVQGNGLVGKQRYKTDATCYGLYLSRDKY
jgi:hypothetical protein